MSFYTLIKYFFPLIEKYSFFISILLFIFWIFQRRSKIYLKWLESRSKNEYSERIKEMKTFNGQSRHNNLKITTSWFDLYKSKFLKSNTTFLFAIIFAYISFNSTSYIENSNDKFFKLLTISTTLFIAGVTYTQNKQN